MEKHDVLSQCYGHLLPPVDSLSNIHKVTFKDKQIYFFTFKIARGCVAPQCDWMQMR